MQLLTQVPTWSGLQTAPGDKTPDVATIGSLASVFSNIIQFIVVISGVLLFIMFIIGGFTFLFSGGDQKKVEQAKGTLTNAVLGLVVLVSSYLILLVIQNLTGVKTDLTIFQIQVP